MDSAQLKRILHCDIEICKYSIGVFPADKIPNGRTGCLIANEDAASKPGSHWVALFLLPDKTCEYFDSYGRNPTAPGIKSIVRTYNIVKNEVQVQSMFSSCCGQHCIYYLYHRCRGVSFPDIINSYDSNQSANDEMVTNFTNFKFGMFEPISDENFLVKQVSTALQNA